MTWGQTNGQLHLVNAASENGSFPFPFKFGNVAMCGPPFVLHPRKDRNDLNYIVKQQNPCLGLHRPHSLQHRMPKLSPEELFSRLSRIQCLRSGLPVQRVLLRRDAGVWGSVTQKVSSLLGIQMQY